MPRLIEFEGRQIQVPDDATDDEVRSILDAPAPAAPATQAAPSAGMATAAPQNSTEVELPDGTVIEVVGVASPEAAARAAHAYMQKRPAASPAGGAASAPSRSTAPPVAGIPTAAPAAQRGWMARTGDAVIDAAMAVPGVIAQGARGVRGGVANVVGLPVDVANAGLSLIGLGTPKPFAGSKSIDEALGGFGAFEISPPQGVVERGVRRVGEEIGAAAVPVGAALNAGKMGVQAARELPILARTFVEPAAAAPAQFVAKEATAAAAAGTGAALANELTGKARAEAEGKTPSAWQNIGDMGGAIGGAGAVGVAQAFGSAAGDIVRAVTGSPKLTSPVVREAAADRIVENYIGSLPRTGAAPDAQPIIDAITGGRRVSDAVPGYRETLADRTGDAGVAALEHSRTTGPNSGLYAQRRAQNTAAVDSALGASAPQGSPADLRGALSVERDRRLTEAADRTRAAQITFDRAADRLQAVRATADARGADIRAALEDAKAAARDVEREAWRGVSDAGEVDIRPLAGAFRRVTDGLSEAERRTLVPQDIVAVPDSIVARAQPGNSTLAQTRADLPVEDRSIFDAIVGGGGGGGGVAPDSAVNVRLGEITGLRSALSSALTEANIARDPARARVVNAYISTIDDYLGRALPAELRGEYDAARAVSRDLNDRFTRPQTAIAQTLDRQQGLYRQPDSAVPDKFVQADEGRIADFEALIREAGSDPRTRSALRDQIISDVRQRGLLDDPERLGAYLGRYRTVLGQFPELRAELGNAAALRRTLGDATTAEAGLVRELGTPERPGRGTVGQYLRSADETTELAFERVLRSPEPGRAADELLRFTGDSPTAVEGARAAFWRAMEKHARASDPTTPGVRPWVPPALRGFLDDSRTAAVAERLYRDNPEHLARIRQIAEAIQGVDLRARPPSAVGGKPAAAGGPGNILTPETVLSRTLAWRRGQIGGPFLIASLAAVAARRAVRRSHADAINRLLDEALLDPDLAALLLRENNPATRAALARRTRGWMTNEASTLADLIAGDETDPVKDAVMR